MEYLTLKVGSPRGPVYEKNFKPSDVFGPFIADLVSDALQIGHVRAGDEYWAAVTPGFDDTLDGAVVKLFEDEPEGARARGEQPDQRRWLMLHPAPDGVDGDRPLRSFDLELHIVGTARRIYCKRFSVAAIHSFTDRITKTLAELGLTRPGEAVTTDLFVRSGDAPEFDREIVAQQALLDDVTDFEIKVEELDAEDDFPEKPVPSCACGFAHDQDEDTVLVLFTKGSLKRLSVFVRSTGSRSREMGGILVGGVYRVPNRRRLYVEIEGHVPATRTQADAVSLRFTHETWQQMEADKRAAFAPGVVTVGWYHTHPPVNATTTANRAVTTVRFFSADDHAVHRQHFKHPWQVALVMDAESSDMGVFRWHRGAVVAGRYHVIKP